MRLTRTVNMLVNSALSILYPQQCKLCGGEVEARADGIICDGCWSNTHFFSEADSLCWRCGRPTAKPVTVERPEMLRCGYCDDEPFTAVRACGIYSGALRAAVLAIKREPFLCRRLSESICRLQKNPPLDGATLLIPVPLHRQREESRGFNQAAVIAAHVARANKIPISEKSLVRISHSEHHRAGMDARGRRDTVVNAFEVLNPSVVQGERILLVDDVFTTGATVAACATALVQAGADEVLVLTLARAAR